MVINSTNINKTNNHLSSYLNSLNTKKATTYDVGNLSPDLGQAQPCGGIKPVNGNTTPPFENWISNCNTYKQTIKNLQPKITTYYHKNNWQY